PAFRCSLSFAVLPARWVGGDWISSAVWHLPSAKTSANSNWASTLVRIRSDQLRLYRPGHQPRGCLNDQCLLPSKLTEEPACEARHRSVREACRDNFEPAAARDHRLTQACSDVDRCRKMA